MISSSFCALTRAAARQAPRAASSSVAAPMALSASAGASRFGLRYYSEQASSTQAKADSKDAAAASDAPLDEDSNAAMKKVQQDFEKAEKELARMKVSITWDLLCLLNCGHSQG